MKKLCGKDSKSGLIHVVAGEEGWRNPSPACGTGVVRSASLKPFRLRAVTCPLCRSLGGLELALNR